MFVFIYLVIVMIILLFMNTRVKFLWNKNYLEVYIYKIRILKLDLQETKRYAYKNLKEYKFKKEDIKYIEILKSIDFRLINIKMCGFQGDYFKWSILYGILNGILGLPKTYFENKDITYNYQIDFYGEPYIIFESIFYFKLGKVLINAWKLRRNVRGKRSSNS